MKILLAGTLVLFISCNNYKTEIKQVIKNGSKAGQDSIQSVHMADASVIMARKQVPVLCYHHLKNKRPGDYVVTPANFAAQIKALADSGFETILPDQLYNYLTTGVPLPDKPVMLTFDDTDLEQFTIGDAEMSKHNFKGVFFIMNIAIGHPRYISKEQIKQLSDRGNSIKHIHGIIAW